MDNYDLHVKLYRSATLPRSTGPSAKPSVKSAAVVFVDDGEIGCSMSEDSAIGTERSSSSASSSECLDVINPRSLADSQRLVSKG